MTGRSPLSASEDQCIALTALAGSRDRGEADRARAVLLTLAGWTSPRIAEAFGVREDTVRWWRSDFMRGGVAALRASVAPGPLPGKSAAALRVALPLLAEPVADRPNWTLSRLRSEIEARAGVRVSRSQLSTALHKKVPLAAATAHAEGTPDRRRGRTGRVAPAAAQTAGRSRR
jgi:transposase